jgi:glycosyltransferase involved in cell wall biosynthesis
MNEQTEEYPLVSAIALAGREQLPDLLHCISCFKSQTYPYKELIIVNNAANQLEASDLNIKAERDIFLLDTPTEMTAGLARAQGMSAANGQIIAQFDIDYWHAPKRLEAQIATLAQQNAHISVLSSCMAYSYISGRASYFENERKAVLSTMVHVRQKEVNYPASHDKNEEFAFLEALAGQGHRPISMPTPELCCKLYLTSESRITEPLNDGLSKPHFKLIQQIMKNRHGS